MLPCPIRSGARRCPCTTCLLPSTGNAQRRRCAQALRTARRGTAAGLSGATCEHYKLLLDDAEAFELFTRAANLLAAARVPANVAAVLGLSRFTALRKPGGGVRGIAAGDTFRRLVSRSLARMFADTFDEATRPYRFALETRAGTDALSGMLRAAVGLDAAATIVSLDGRRSHGHYVSAQAARRRLGTHPVRAPLVWTAVHILLVAYHP